MVQACIVDKDLFASEFVIRAERSEYRLLEIPIEILEKRGAFDQSVQASSHGAGSPGQAVRGNSYQRLICRTMLCSFL